MYVLPACLPACLPASRNPWENGGQCKPCLDWHIVVANNPWRRLGPACPTRRHLGPFTITPCSQTGKLCPGHIVLKLLPPTPTPNWCCFIQLPKLLCPGPLDRTIVTPLHLQSVSVAALTHPTGLMVAKASSVNSLEQHSSYYRRCCWRNMDSASLGGRHMKNVGIAFSEPWVQT